MRSRLWFSIPSVLLIAGFALASDDGAAKDTSAARASRFPRVRLGGIMIGAGYSHMSGRGLNSGYGYRPWGPWGVYDWPYASDPWFYGPSLHPGFFTGFGYGPLMGEIKLKTEDRNAWVYLDGALAGKAGKLRTMWLEPGAYSLEVRSGNKHFEQRVYVLSGKTLRLTAGLQRSEVRP